MSDAYKLPYNTWQEKTEWVQTDRRFDVLLPWGKHRADVLKEYIERLESHIADMAVQLANAESKCSELGTVVAENAVLKTAAKETLAHWAAAEDGEMELMMDKCMPALRDAYCKTPSTDAFLAEVRAQGVDIAIAELKQLAHRSEKEAPIAAEHHRSAALYLQLFSSQLRQEAAQ